MVAPTRRCATSWGAMSLRRGGTARLRPQGVGLGQGGSLWQVSFCRVSFWEWRSGWLPALLLGVRRQASKIVW